MAACFRSNRRRCWTVLTPHNSVEATAKGLAPHKLFDKKTLLYSPVQPKPKSPVNVPSRLPQGLRKLPSRLPQEEDDYFLIV